MEKKDLLGVRKKRRRKVVTPAKAGGAGGLAKVIAAYLAADSYMYAPLVSAPPAHPPAPPTAAAVAPSAAPPISTPVRKLAPKPNRGKAAKNKAKLLKATIVFFRESIVRQRLTVRSSLRRLSRAMDRSRIQKSSVAG